jgi:hypothetical protein
MTGQRDNNPTEPAHLMSAAHGRRAYGDQRMNAKTIRAQLESLDPCADDNTITHLSAEVLTPLVAAHIGYVASGARTCAVPRVAHKILHIGNDDQLYTLSVLIFGPQQLAAAYGTHVHSDTENAAAFSFWRGVGEHMGLRDIPKQPAAYQKWMSSAESSRGRTVRRFRCR